MSCVRAARAHLRVQYVVRRMCVRRVVCVTVPDLLHVFLIYRHLSASSALQLSSRLRLIRIIGSCSALRTIIDNNHGALHTIALRGALRTIFDCTAAATLLPGPAPVLSPLTPDVEQPADRGASLLASRFPGPAPSAAPMSAAMCVQWPLAGSWLSVSATGSDEEGRTRASEGAGHGSAPLWTDGMRREGASRNAASW